MAVVIAHANPPHTRVPPTTLRLAHADERPPPQENRLSSHPDDSVVTPSTTLPAPPTASASPTPHSSPIPDDFVVPAFSTAEPVDGQRWSTWPVAHADRARPPSVRPSWLVTWPPPSTPSSASSSRARRPTSPDRPTVPTTSSWAPLDGGPRLLLAAKRYRGPSRATSTVRRSTGRPSGPQHPRRPGDGSRLRARSPRAGRALGRGGVRRALGRCTHSACRAVPGADLRHRGPDGVHRGRRRAPRPAWPRHGRRRRSVAAVRAGAEIVLVLARAGFAHGDLCRTTCWCTTGASSSSTCRSSSTSRATRPASSCSNATAATSAPGSPVAASSDRIRPPRFRPGRAGLDGRAGAGSGGGSVGVFVGLGRPRRPLRPSPAGRTTSRAGGAARDHRHRAS